MQQAIIWTNVDPIYRRIYAALGGAELMIEKNISIFHANLYKKMIDMYIICHSKN